MQIGLDNLGHHLSKLVCRVWIPTRRPYASAVSMISLISPCQTINYTSSRSVCWWLGVLIHSAVQWWGERASQRERLLLLSKRSLSIFRTKSFQIKRVFRKVQCPCPTCLFPSSIHQPYVFCPSVWRSLWSLTGRVLLLWGECSIVSSSLHLEMEPIPIAFGQKTGPTWTSRQLHTGYCTALHPRWCVEKTVLDPPGCSSWGCTLVISLRQLLCSNTTNAASFSPNNSWRWA